MHAPEQPSSTPSRTTPFDRRAKRNVILLLVVFLTGLWRFYGYRTWTNRQEAIGDAGQRPTQMTHAVEQSVQHLFKVSDLFKTATEPGLATNPGRDPRTDRELTASMNAFRKLTDNQIDARFISAVEGTVLQITVSIGVVQMSHTDMDALLLYADRALYRAKDQGRNQTVVLDPGRDDRRNGGGASSQG